MTTATTIRNIIVILGSIDRHEIEAEAGPLLNTVWIRFRDDPFREFRRMGDSEQEAIARIVSARMAPAGGEGVVGDEPSLVQLTTGMRELRASLIARAVRQSLRNYGHKSAESALPECIAVDVERTLVADEKLWSASDERARDCGINGGPLTEARDCIGSAYTRAALSTATPPVSAREATSPVTHVVGITDNMRSEACRVLNERGKGNAITIPDVYAMLEAALVAHENDDLPQVPWPASGWALNRISHLEDVLRNFTASRDISYVEALEIARAALATATEGSEG